jgi:hypothetical protein
MLLACLYTVRGQHRCWLHPHGRQPTLDVRAMPARRYLHRGLALRGLTKYREAVQDFTVCLELPSCQPHQHFTALLNRGLTRQSAGAAC